ncbi:MAG: peptide deformylase [Candidatus Levybacteria bacterium RIFCSPLOWO2_01_FULL_39_10]|nr:MAG: peptide deformylase [Candidatus Levybacteria bacterium RIFCSPLOWO2_01_FULL_39_10]
MLKIITAPDKILAKKTENYIFKDKDRYLPRFLKGMEASLLSADDPKGVGLAAPQVGKSVSIFMAKPSEKSKISVFINPVMLDTKSRPKKNTKGREYRKLEGCLSLPNIWGEVVRADEIKLSYFDEKGKVHVEKFDGFMATVIQHEIDHLVGILFPKRVLEQGGKLFKSRKENGKDVFDELEI